MLFLHDHKCFKIVLTPATSQIIRMKPPTGSLNNVGISWNRPLYDPIKYHIAYSCRLKKQSSAYVNKKFSHIQFSTTLITVPDLMPNSICEVTLIAVYNPASINDPGISITINTLETYERKRSCKI